MSAPSASPVPSDRYEEHLHCLRESIAELVGRRDLSVDGHPGDDVQPIPGR
jgi:hypothetical protein